MCDLFLTASSQQLSSSSAFLLWVHFKHDCTHFWPSSFCASFFLYSCYCLIRINMKKMLEKVSLENSSAKLRRTLVEKEQRNIIRSMQRATSQATEQLSANTSIPFLFFFRVPSLPLTSPSPVTSDKIIRYQDRKAFVKFSLFLAKGGISMNKLSSAGFFFLPSWFHEIFDLEKQILPFRNPVSASYQTNKIQRKRILFDLTTKNSDQISRQQRPAHLIRRQKLTIQDSRR